MAQPPSKHRPFLDHEDPGVEVALTARARMELDPLFRMNASAEPAAHADRRDVDVRVHVRGLADDEEAPLPDGALELTVDAQRVLKRELAMELGADVEEPRKVPAPVILPLTMSSPFSLSICSETRGFAVRAPRRTIS